MSTLEWRPCPDSTAEVALGRTWRYLIASDAGHIVLTRTAISAVVWSATAEGALNAIQVANPVPGTETEAVTRVHMRVAAQRFEDGEDIAGYRAWRQHGQEPDGMTCPVCGGPHQYHSDTEAAAGLELGPE